MRIFLSAGHPLTMPNRVILCQTYDAIKKNSVYIDFMCRRDDLWWSKLILHMIIHWKFFLIEMISNALIYIFFGIFHVFFTCCENGSRKKCWNHVKTVYLAIWNRLNETICWRRIAGDFFDQLSTLWMFVWKD